MQLSSLFLASTALVAGVMAAPTSQQDFPMATTGNYSQMAVDAHNIHRRNNSAIDVKWNATLAEAASITAANCSWEHSTAALGGGYGQNYAANSVGYQNISAIVSDQWYNGEINSFNGLYGQPSPPFDDSWAHYTQVVWNSSLTIGCAYYDCTSKGGISGLGIDAPVLTVCDYFPVGNVYPMFDSNVFQPMGEPTVTK